MIAPPRFIHASRHLQINLLILMRTALDEPLDQCLPAVSGQRIIQAHRIQAALQTGQMFIQTKSLARINGDDLIHAIAK